MKIIAFRHAVREDLGTLAPALQKAGCAYSYIDTYREDLAGFDALAPDLLVVLGGAPGVYQEDLYPFIGREIAVLEKRLAAGRAVLGVCLGAQMMAAALGSRVYKGEKGTERGWVDLAVNETGKKTPVRHFDKAHTRMMQWHGDTFDLPDGATLLASSAMYKHQIFSYGKNALALQCHAEVTPEILESWLVSSAGDAAAGKVDIRALRADNLKNAGILRQQTEKFVGEWLADITVREKDVA